MVVLSLEKLTGVRTCAYVVPQTNSFTLTESTINNSPLVLFSILYPWRGFPNFVKQNVTSILTQLFRVRVRVNLLSRINRLVAVELVGVASKRHLQTADPFFLI